jgi:adhesin HecA-like repeat protein
MWLDGADPNATGVPPANGATVTTWYDKSGSGYNATPLSGFGTGTYSSAYKAIYFPNATTAYSTNYSGNPTTETMFVVFNNPSPSGNNNMVIGGPRGARSLAGGYSGTTGVGAVSYLNNEVTWSGIASMPAGTYTSGTTVIITGTVNNASSTISQNGGTTYTASGTAFNSYVVNTYLGIDTYYSPPSYYYIGYEMEIIFYNSVLTVPQRQQVEGYLAWKWGLQSSLPTTHPFKKFSP